MIFSFLIIYKVNTFFRHSKIKVSLLLFDYQSIK
nr:MAG TPA: hypothetical protein [Caudoviricetes sp.]